jgi:hypothetical protein
VNPETEARWRADMDMTSRRERALWDEIDRLRNEIDRLRSDLFGWNKWR